MVLMRYSDTVSDVTQREIQGRVTKTIRKSNNFLLSFVKLHKTISALSLSRWYVSTLQQAGVDISVWIAFNSINLNLTLSAKRFIRQRNKQSGKKVISENVCQVL